MEPRRGNRLWGRLRLACALHAAVRVPAAVALGDSATWDGKTEPNDPGYDQAEHDPVGYSITSEEWFLYSFMPKCTPLARDPEAASGLSQIPRSHWGKPFHHSTDLSSTKQYDVTIRVQATDERGDMGEDRRSIDVFHDPTIRPGFPLKLGQGLESQPVMAGLQGTGKLDLVFADASGHVYAIDQSGHELPGWPTHTAPLDLGLANTPAGRAGDVPTAYDPVITPAAVGDLDGDGTLEVVLTSTNGRAYVFDRFGHMRGCAASPGGPRTSSVWAGGAQA